MERRNKNLKIENSIVPDRSTDAADGEDDLLSRTHKKIPERTNSLQ
jgi:hypothetical protein